MENPIDIALIKRYQRGELNAEEQADFEKRLANDPFAQDALEGMSLLDVREQETHLIKVEERVAERVLGPKEVAMPASTNSDSTESKDGAVWGGWPMKVAAAILVVAGSYSVYQQYFGTTSAPQEQLAINEAIKKDSIIPIEAVPQEPEAEQIAESEIAPRSPSLAPPAAEVAIEVIPTESQAVETEEEQTEEKEELLAEFSAPRANSKPSIVTEDNTSKAAQAENPMRGKVAGVHSNQPKSAPPIFEENQSARAADDLLVKRKKARGEPARRYLLVELRVKGETENSFINASSEQVKAFNQRMKRKLLQVTAREGIRIPPPLELYFSANKAGISSALTANRPKSQQFKKEVLKLLKAETQLWSQLKTETDFVLVMTAEK